MNDSEASDQVTAMLGYCELLLEGVYGPLTPKQERVIRDLQKMAEAAAEVLRRSLKREERPV
jgi:hypothetical protein